eukprot:TRINITY_DN14694_c0_g1_i1.p1 TRINITY_DN14694_c0_g1~~TRINITY_DN14694_c0_g1_i1.p1  ORF type:complete len:172 (+),score=23.69 TRINITY_DN14694_c0_g1_i1:62-577(+)
MLTRKHLLVLYVNVVFLTSVVTMFALFSEEPLGSQKRAFPDYVDVANITCSEDEDVCGPHGDCIAPAISDPSNPEWHDSVCLCHTGWVHYDGICDYEQRPQLNAFMASFFGGLVGADWFYLFNGGNGGYIVAGIFKLLTLGGCGIWWLVDWIRVLTFTFPDSRGVNLRPMN